MTELLEQSLEAGLIPKTLKTRFDPEPNRQLAGDDVSFE
jgi:hypothetical protein